MNVKKSFATVAIAAAVLIAGNSSARAAMLITTIGLTDTAINWTNVGGAGSPTPEGGRVEARMVNNSGISTVGGQLVHNGTNDANYSNLTQQTGGLIIDLGATYNLALMQIWNFETVFGPFETFGPNTFDFYYTTNPLAVTTLGGTLNVANLSLFTNLTNDTALATATEPDYLGETYTFGSPTVPAEIGDESGASQSLSATTITARYIFLDDLDGSSEFGGRLGFSELKFYEAVPIPEPSSFALLMFGGMGLWRMRRMRTR